LPSSRRRFNFRTFFTDKTNFFAEALARSVVEESCQGNPLVLLGGYGVGKTHLLLAIGRAWHKKFPDRRVCYVTAENFTNSFVETFCSGDGAKKETFRTGFRQVKLLLIDEISFLKGKTKTQEELANIIDTLLLSGAQIVCASNVHPVDIGLTDGRLLSRLRGGLIAEIFPPQLGTKRGILDRLIEESQMGSLWPSFVRDLVVSQTNGDTRVLLGVFNSLSSLVRLVNEPLNAESAQRIIGCCVGKEISSSLLSLDVIEQAVEEYFGFRQRNYPLRSQSRARDVVHPRHIAIYLAKKLLPEVALSILVLILGEEITLPLFILVVLLISFS
ncbi:MAG TPA: DnaA/Hda family protein, partial [Candidatus Paceibacterota bacterium]|nr:DnaA/Hda family protein [Candidatus Paceibacterota bacterium]